MIHQMKDSIDRKIGVIDETNTVVACSDLTNIGESRPEAREDLLYTGESVILNGYTYRAVDSNTNPEYIVFVEGDDDESGRMASILAVSLDNVKNLYDEKFDKSSFIKNIILDNVLPNEIFAKCKELKFNVEASRVVMLIRFMTKTDALPFEVVQSMFPDKNRDYVININETDIVLVRELSDTYDINAVQKTAETIVDTISTEFFAKVSIGIGTPVDNIKDIAKSYKEAMIALEVGKVFDTVKNVMTYENLGIGRLIYQLPTTLCEIFLQEVFKKGSLDSLDRETLMTIQCFFENNLNVSETSRKLFVHRNTLVYRLEKIRRLTGLDLREFEHAVTFKVALMVKKYLVSRPSKF